LLKQSFDGTGENFSTANGKLNLKTLNEYNSKQKAICFQAVNYRRCGYKNISNLR